MNGLAASTFPSTSVNLDTTAFTRSRTKSDAKSHLKELDRLNATGQSWSESWRDWLTGTSHREQERYLDKSDKAIERTDGDLKSKCSSW